MVTRLYFHAATSTVSGTLPSTEQSTLTAADNFEANQATNRNMDTTIGTAQTSLQNASTASTSQVIYYIGRWVSPLVNQTSVAANTWTYNFAAQESNTQANFPTNATQATYVNCYVWKPSNGTKVGTILDGTTAAAFSEPSLGAEKCLTGTFTGAAVSSLTAGDAVIIFEAWAQVTQGSATSYTQSYFFDGSTATLTSGTTVSNHASFIETPEDITFGGGLTRVVNADTLKYNVLKQIKQPDTLKYNVIGRVTNSNTIKYNVLKQVKQPNTLKYNILKQILHNQTLKYNIIGRIKHANTLKYNVLKQVKQPQTLKYNVLKQIKQPNTLKYNVLKQIKQNQTLKYNLLKQILHANTLKYNLISRVLHAYTLKYHVLKQIKHNQTLKYNIIGRIVHANTLRYNVLKQIKQQNTLKYNVLKQITHANTLKYNLLKQIKHANTLQWNIFANLARIVHAYTLKYNIIGRVTHQNTLKYNLLKQIRSLITWDDFEAGTYNFTEGTASPNGKWVNQYLGGTGASSGVRFSSSAGSNVMYEKPQVSTSSGESHATFNLATPTWGDFDLTVRQRTVQQLRTGSAPNAWETAWILFRYTDAYHHYYLVYKTSGVELGRKDYATPQEQQIFLATPSSPTVTIGNWDTIRIKAVRNHFTVWINGTQVIDMTDDGSVGFDTATSGLPVAPSSAMYNGQIGLYNEDAEVEFDNVQTNPVLKYNVLKQVKQSRTLKYNIFKQIKHAVTLQWNILANLARIVHANTLKYNLIGRVIHQNTLRYNILKQVKQNQTLKYSILKQVLRANTLKYNLLQQIKHANTLRYNLLKQVKHANTLQWNLFAQLSRIVHADTLKYNILAQVKHQDSLYYNVLKQIKHPQTIKYNLLKQVLHANTLRYNIIGRIVHSNILKYNVLKQIKQQNTLKYSVLKQVKLARTLKYNLLKQVLHSNTLKYNVLSLFTRVLHSFTLKWNVKFGQRPDRGGWYSKAPKLKQIRYPVYIIPERETYERRLKLRKYPPLAVIPAFTHNINQTVAPFVITDPVQQKVYIRFILAPDISITKIIFEGKTTIPIVIVPTTQKKLLNKARCASFVPDQKAITTYGAKLNKLSRVFRVWNLAKQLFNSSD